MQELQGNLWDYYDRGEWIVITTNGLVKKNNQSVMGRGIAAQCAARFPRMPSLLGAKLHTGGNHVYPFLTYRLITMPTKHHWYNNADLRLIARSAAELIGITDRLGLKNVYLPRPGCSNGKLKWADVKPLLKDLDDRFTIVDLESEHLPGQE